MIRIGVDVGGTNTDANSYDIFVTKNGQFRPSAVGV